MYDDYLLQWDFGRWFLHSLLLSSPGKTSLNVTQLRGYVTLYTAVVQPAIFLHKLPLALFRSIQFSSTFSLRRPVFTFNPLSIISSPLNLLQMA